MNYKNRYRLIYRFNSYSLLTNSTVHTQVTGSFCRYPDAELLDGRCRRRTCTSNPDGHELYSWPRLADPLQSCRCHCRRAHASSGAERLQEREHQVRRAHTRTRRFQRRNGIKVFWPNLFLPSCTHEISQERPGTSQFR